MAQKIKLATVHVTLFPVLRHICHISSHHMLYPSSAPPLLIFSLFLVLERNAFSSCAFRVSTPTVWTSLDDTIRYSETSTFQRRLKTHLFQAAFNITPYSESLKCTNGVLPCRWYVARVVCLPPGWVNTDVSRLYSTAASVPSPSLQRSNHNDSVSTKSKTDFIST